MVGTYFIGWLLRGWRQHASMVSTASLPGFGPLADGYRQDVGALGAADVNGDVEMAWVTP